MSFTVVVLGLVVIAGCTALVVHLRRTTNQPARESSSDEFPVPTFNVVSLGLQGSGKTLLLTSIYRTLQVPRDRSYYLKAPYDQLIELNRWYRETADSRTDWPEGTTRGEMREYEFSVVAHLTETPETVLKLGYLEYPGELLTDRDAPGSTAQARLLAAIASAHALVGIIDGLMVLRAYRGDPRGRVTLQSTLDSMIHGMLATRTPIVFVITKWDLLDGLEPARTPGCGSCATS
ncbi:hypothetical protein [Labedaea rhizosphaerae]|uniref:Uncharacterized protein n=1 Tax=Labedaea rhizosphaerae TaxID=598644 RepID=A0A4R6RSQ0_LABRH|nr:hypothetical protein [Labedaea rhizosphaerae]TDP89909.1 hypothetical protein EV186_11135 [Labedaea rhizosphaerae]